MNMKRHTSKASAIIAGAALVAALGLAGCGGSQTASSSASGQASEPAARTAEELGGEFVIQVNTEGDGEVAYAQNGEDMGYADSAFTHADAGDVITLKAKAGKYDSSSKFVKWTKDGADFSSEPEVDATVDGDAEFVAVFE